jgi:hypothetical protein
MKMKNALLLSFLGLYFLLYACHDDPVIRVGFDTEFGKKSQGLTMMDVNNNQKTVSLQGDVFVTSGGVLVELINPKGEIVFSNQITFPDCLLVNEAFHSVSGTWRLKYKSLEGTGSITLHLNIVDKNEIEKLNKKNVYFSN